MTIRIHIKLVVLNIVFSTTLFAGDVEKQLLETIETTFLNGEYDAASRLIKKIDISADTEEQEKQTYYYYLARLSSVFKNKVEMRRSLSSLYEINPDFELDVYVDSPGMLSFWNKLQKSDSQRSYTRRGTRAVSKTSLLPFGIGHFYHDKPLGGSLFLAFELPLITLTIAPLFASLSGSSPAEKQTMYALGFFGIWGYELGSVYSALGSQQLSLGKMINWFPFGAGQRKNGSYIKAILFGSFQAMAAYYMVSGESETKNLATVVFLGSYGYGVYEAFESERRIKRVSHNKFGFEVLPFSLVGGGSTLGFALSASAFL